jgi:Holliday junction DNA helicase RuvA
MIGWLRGEVADPWQQANRCGLLLLCQGVGYELLTTQRHWQRLPAAGSELALYVHLSVREDGWQLYGFPDRQERDLFRELVAVSGVGPQMALALLGCHDAAALVEAVVRGDLRALMRAPGVGRRTAERLSVELRSRLQDRFPGLLEGAVPALEDLPAGSAMPAADGSREVEITLEALGYEGLEIHRALRAVAAEGLAAGADTDAWIRECLRWLSRSAA